MADLRKTLTVTANTKEAQRDLDTLKKQLDTIKTAGLGVKVETVGGSEIEEHGQQSITREFKDLSGAMQELTKAIKNARLGNNASNTGTAPSSVPNSETSPSQTPKIDNKLGDFLGKAVAAIGSAGSIISYTKNGARRSADLESRALRQYNSLGVYDSDFNKARRDVSTVGREYGFSADESLNTQGSLLAGGFTDLESLNTDTRSIMTMSRAYGLDTYELSEQAAQNSRLGLSKPGDVEKQNNLLADFIKSNNMKGREVESLRVIGEIRDYIADGRIEVTDSNVRDLAGMVTALGDQNSSLKGERGLNAVKEATSMFDSDNEMMLRAVGYGGKLGYGIEGRIQAKMILDKAKAGDWESMQIALEGMKNLFGVDTKEEIATVIEAMTSNNMEASLEMADLFEKGDKEGYERFVSAQGNDKEENLKNAQESKAYNQEVYDVNKDNAQTEAGNLANEATRGAKGIYNNVPVPLQTIGSVAGGVLMSQALGRGVGYGVGKLGSLFKGVGSAAPAAAPATGAGGVGLLSKIGGLSKYSKHFGVLGSLFNLGIHGAEAYGQYKEGNYEDASGTVGKGIGSTGGALLGAKGGAIAGTAIMPGIGTAVGGALGALVGGLSGSKLGDIAGRGLFGLFDGEDNKSKKKSKSNKVADDVEPLNLVGRKENIVARVEDILDRIESGKFFVNGTQEASDKGFNNMAKQMEKFLKTFSRMVNKLNELNKSSGRTYVSSADAAPIDMKGTNASIIWKYFKSKGFSDEATAGILGNFQRESGLKPEQKQIGGGPGRGLAQWGGPRFTDLERFAKERGTEWDNMQTQLDYVMYELETKFSKNWVEKYKKMDDVAKAAVEFEDVYEGAGVEAHPERIKAAQEFYNQRNELNPKEVKESGKSTASSYAVGNERLSKDQFAFLHKDEAVLNKFEAREYREKKNNIYDNLPNIENVTQSNNPININLSTTINSSDTNVAKEIERMVTEGVKNAMKAFNSNNGQQIDLSRNFVRRPI